jgi:hypothetical protein
MLTFRQHKISFMVLFAVALHLFWAITLMVDSAALNVNAISALHRFIHSPSLLIFVLLGVAISAGSCVFCRLPWWMLVPQQAILMMSAAGAIESMWLAQFADGVLRSTAFIAADQIYSVLTAMGHSAALVAYSLRSDE